MLKVKIKIEDTNGKSAEIKLSEVDNLHKLVIIQSVFNLFGVNVDVVQMTQTYKQIGKAYENFFNEVSPIEPELTNSIQSMVEEKKEFIRQQLINGLVENKEELDYIYKSDSDEPEYYRTGIKVDSDGRKRYKLRYKCPACFHQGTHYIYPESAKTWCHRCRHEMIVLLAGKKYMERDTFGNYFRAGDYKDRNIFGEDD